tara:strand:+ start:888 stop:1352 length:465 start_codon:yes stop_codon:yes gene_type:complete
LRKIFLLLIFSLDSYSDISNDLNDFFNNELSFIQTSKNKLNNISEESKGIYKKNTNESVIIEVNYPFRETYLINQNEIKIHDHEFDQVKRVPINKINNNLIIDYLINGFPEDFKNKINESEIEFSLDFVNKNTLRIKFKDNMEIDNVIEFIKDD